jgi:hypothetical protein
MTSKSSTKSNTPTAEVAVITVPEAQVTLPESFRIVTRDEAKRAMTPDQWGEATRATLGVDSAVGRIGQDGVMWNLAVLTHNASTVSGLIGTGSGQETKGSKVDPVRAVERGGWKSARDYAVALGKSPGYVTKLVLLGRAAMVHGVAQGSPEWGFLVTHAGASPWKEILREDKSQNRRLKSMIARARKGEEPEAPKGDDKGDKGETRAPGGTTVQTKPETPSVPSPPTLRDVESAWETSVRGPLSKLSDEDFLTFSTRVARDLAKAKAARETASKRNGKAPAKGKAPTPADVAKAKATATPKPDPAPATA